MNIKIVDFGLSNTYKKDTDTLKTACGSPCYASPEMIAGKRYLGIDTDLWSLGVILYAMTVGYLPFEDPDTNKLYKKILESDFITPGYVEKPCRELIKSLLKTEPTQRIKIPEIKMHQWYLQINEAKLEGIVVGQDKIPVLEQIHDEIKSSS
jgi:5'-AMP-activated protein kinase catalytic alpha subunit